MAYFGIVTVPGVTPVKQFKIVEGSKDQTGGLTWSLTSPLQLLVNQAAGRLNNRLERAAPKAHDKPQAKSQPDLGDAKLASLWNDMDVNQLIGITTKWHSIPLAKVLARMDSDQVTKYLDALKPDRADEICRAIRSLASQPSPLSLGG